MSPQNGTTMEPMGMYVTLNPQPIYLVMGIMRTVICYRLCWYWERLVGSVIFHFSVGSDHGNDGFLGRAWTRCAAIIGDLHWHHIHTNTLMYVDTCIHACIYLRVYACTYICVCARLHHVLILNVTGLTLLQAPDHRWLKCGHPHHL